MSISGRNTPPRIASAQKKIEDKKAEIEKLPERHEARTNPDLMVVRSEILKFDFKVEYRNSTSAEELTEQMLKLVTKDELPQKEVPSETDNTGAE